MNLTPVVARQTSLPANLWRTAAPLALALAWTTPALAGFGAGEGTGGSDGGDCPPECMCAGLDCPDVPHADCSTCFPPGGEGEDDCIEKDGTSCSVPWSETTVSVTDGAGPSALWCDQIFEKPDCALVYYYTLATCAGQAPVPKFIEIGKGIIDVGGAVDEILDALSNFGLAAPKNPSVDLALELMICEACVLAADKIAEATCPEVLGVSPVWGYRTGEVCHEAITNEALFPWHESMILDLAACYEL